MVCHGVRACEDRASLTVHALAVGEEQRFAGRIVFVEDTALSYETLVHEGRVADLHAGSDDKIRALDTAAETNRSGFVGVDRTVLEPAHTAQFGVVTYVHVLD